jgi:hypothetical protein
MNPWQVSWLQMANRANRSPSPEFSPSGITSGYSLFTVAGPRRYRTGLPFQAPVGTIGQFICTTATLDSLHAMALLLALQLSRCNIAVNKPSKEYP